jgi:hypothetical protein
MPFPGYSILSTTIFLGSILISKEIAGNGCNPGSLWCWSIACAGLLTFLYYYVFEKKRS